MVKVCFITIGQSPRDDVLLEINPLLVGIEIRQKGVLDNMTEEEIMKELSPVGGDILVSKLRSGKEVRLDRKKVIARLKDLIRECERENDVLVLLCTDEFSQLSSTKLLLRPYYLMRNLVMSFEGAEKIGVLVPLREQIGMAVKKWSNIGEVIVEAFSPYSGKIESLISIADRFRDTDLIILDCIGYKLIHKKVLRNRTGKPVILPKTLLARTIREVFTDML
ncbi:MAG: AroM family protein [Candidatus Njordarchaeales archaeon]